WVEGWGCTGKGRIYKVADPARAKDPLVAEVKKLLAEGMSKRPVAELAKLLEHPDQRIRQEAQFALAERDTKEADEALLRVAHESNDQLARLHAIWGLGQRANHTGVPPLVQKLLADPDAEVRAQVAKVLGRRPPVLRLLTRPHPGLLSAKEYREQFQL